MTRLNKPKDKNMKGEKTNFKIGFMSKLMNVKMPVSIKRLSMLEFMLNPGTNLAAAIKAVRLTKK